MHMSLPKIASVRCPWPLLLPDAMTLGATRRSGVILFVS